MKAFLLSVTVAAITATSALAGGLADEVVQAPIIEVAPEPTGSLPGWVIPLAIVGLVIAVASSSDGDPEPGPPGI